MYLKSVGGSKPEQSLATIGLAQEHRLMCLPRLTFHHVFREKNKDALMSLLGKLMARFFLTFLSQSAPSSSVPTCPPQKRDS
jgi:hypothetical protein